MPKFTNEELTKLLEAIAEAYEKSGKKITHAIHVENIDQDGNITGEILIDNKPEKH